MRKQVLFPLIVMLLAAKFALDTVADTDLFWHLRLGTDMLEKGRLPTKVLYTWTFEGDWPPFDWLSQLFMALAFRPFGYVSLALAKALLAALLGLCIYRAAFLRADGNANAAALTAAAMVFAAAGNLSTRPLLLGHLFLAAEVLLLEELRRGASTKLVLLFPPLFILWGNCHGSWPIGLLPLGTALASARLPIRLKFWRPVSSDLLAFGTPKRPRKSAGLKSQDILGWCPAFLKNRLLNKPRRGLMLLLLAVCLCAPLCQLLTPAPLKFLTRPFLWTLGGTEALMDESLAVPLSHPSFWILAVLGVVSLGLSATSRLPRITLFDALAFLLTFVLACMHFRMMACFAVIGAPVLSGLLAPRLGDGGFEHGSRNFLFAALAALVLGGICALSALKAPSSAATQVPAALIDRLAASDLGQQRGFNYFDWGGYLVLRKVPTFIDGRLEPFAASGVFETYLAIERSGDAARLEQQDVRWVLTQAGLPLADALRQRPGWTLSDEDEGIGAELWVRGEAQP